MPFGEKTIFAPLYCLCFFVKDRLTVSIDVVVVVNCLHIFCSFSVASLNLVEMSAAHMTELTGLVWLCIFSLIIYLFLDYLWCVLFWFLLYLTLECTVRLLLFSVELFHIVKILKSSFVSIFCIILKKVFFHPKIVKTLMCVFF